ACETVVSCAGQWARQVGAMAGIFFFPRRGRHTSFSRDWSSDVCSSDLSPYHWTQPAAPATSTATASVIGLPTASDSRSASSSARSEERRVGNEGRCRWTEWQESL